MVAPWEPPGSIPARIPGWPDDFRPQHGLSFRVPPSALDALWWHHRYGAPHGLTPLGMSKMLFAGLPGEQLYDVRYIDHLDESFEIGAEGREGGVTIWVAGVALELREDRILWDRLESTGRGRGLGRIMARHLLDAATALDIRKLAIVTEDVGSYLWAEAGFIPDRVVWGLLRQSLYGRLIGLQRHLSARSARILHRIVTDPGSDPGDIRIVASLDDVVPAQHARNAMAQGTARLGQEMLVGLRWSGGIDITIQSHRQRLEEWLAT